MDCLSDEGSFLKRASMCMLGYTVATSILTTVVFSGVFGLANPDKPAFYGVVQVQQSLGDAATQQQKTQLMKLFATREEAIEANAVDIADVHSRLVAWCLWGFFMALSPIPMGILIAISHCINFNCGKFVNLLSTCAFGCSLVAWWITGIIWRFRLDGRFACGDIIQHESANGGENVAVIGDDELWFKENVLAKGSLYQYLTGQFMKIFYFFCWTAQTLIALILIFNALIKCLSDCCSRNKDRN